MAELKFSTIWEIKDYSEYYAPDMIFESDEHELIDLQHPSFPNLKWEARFYGQQFFPTGFLGFGLFADFNASDAKNLWASAKATLLNEAGEDIAAFELKEVDCTAEGWDRNENGSFSMEDVNKAVRKDGSLCLRIDLTILKVREMLKCRDLLRALLSNGTRPDLEIDVAEDSFQLHTSILAETSPVFARMFNEGAITDGFIALPDTTPEAFQAFAQAVYFDNWNFVSDIDLTQDVLYLAAKFKVDNLKDQCDTSLVEKVTESNALELLTKSAATCNAEKTKAACIDILAENMEFKESPIWLDFKKRNRGVALEILDVVSDKWIAANKNLKRKLDAATSAGFKRKFNEETEEPSSGSKRRRN